MKTINVINSIGMRQDCRFDKSQDEERMVQEKEFIKEKLNALQE